MWRSPLNLFLDLDKKDNTATTLDTESQFNPNVTAKCVAPETASSVTQQYTEVRTFLPTPKTPSTVFEAPKVTDRMTPVPTETFWSSSFDSVTSATPTAQTSLTTSLSRSLMSPATPTPSWTSIPKQSDIATVSYRGQSVTPVTKKDVPESAAVRTKSSHGRLETFRQPSPYIARNQSHCSSTQTQAGGEQCGTIRDEGTASMSFWSPFPPVEEWRVGRWGESSTRTQTFGPERHQSKVEGLVTEEPQLEPTSLSFRDEMASLDRLCRLMSSNLPTPPTLRPHQNLPISCNFCKRNGESPRYYKSHPLMNSAGIITCPILRRYVCPLCGATGDNAHTVSYCRYSTGESAMAASRTPRKSCGCLRDCKHRSNNRH